ncbi:HSP20-like chaperone [Coccomyxa subellipsoidea C-169]|uniref:HSP20-like chaperone n=1 Tax=Coccomyxa subellipsoidea (strain C-169) TaxID=574566 RepID=I0Z935_COCSC|nr:HSP20-like chaperone [Coccomyxa subellipsoidea C-169]EIE27154.1 HSP20-like chaperone [Coccomyxa subellipsoidea C-169]|eukprot:XP_005651698.1 HSP20-like chaperone [Coccomyxa subellipsoidea C-169]
MLRALTKLPRARLASRSGLRNATTAARRAQEGERTAQDQGALQQQTGDQRGTAPTRYTPSVLTNPFSLTRDLAPLMPSRVSSLFRDLEQELDSLTRGVLSPSSQVDRELAPFTPRSSLGAVDVKETDSAYEFDVDVPGLTKNEIKVSVDRDGVLTISGERKVEDEEGDDKQGFRRIERGFGKFVRRFQLPDNTDPEHVQAKVDNGVLKIVVPKSADHGPTVTDVPIE